MKTKICTKCKQEKTIDNFTKQKTGRNGLKSKCKTCEAEWRARHYIQNRKEINAKNAIWRKNNKERIAEINRDYRHRPEVKERINLQKRQRRYLYRAQIKARKEVEKAVNKGNLPHIISQQCNRCNNQAVHYHHYKGYEKQHWLDIIPLCQSCHKN